MSRSGLLILLLAVVAGYFGLGTVAGTPGTAAFALVGVFVAVLLVSWVYESVSRRRWIV
jgi:uncharacterized membrane protein YtjA (UPF0391 family)